MHSVRLDLPLAVIDTLRGFAGAWIEYEDVTWIVGRIDPPGPFASRRWDPSTALPGCGTVVLRRPRDDRTIGAPGYVINPGDVARVLPWPEDDFA